MHYFQFMSKPRHAPRTRQAHAKLQKNMKIKGEFNIEIYGIISWNSTFAYFPSRNTVRLDNPIYEISEFYNGDKDIAVWKIQSFPRAYTHNTDPTRNPPDHNNSSTKNTSRTTTSHKTVSFERRKPTRLAKKPTDPKTRQRQQNTPIHTKHVYFYIGDMWWASRRRRRPFDVR